MPWEKGQSGNAKGRPPKARALTDLLERTGKKKTGSGAAAKQVFVDKIWQALTTGVITYPAVKVQVEKLVTQPDGKELLQLVEVEKTPTVIIDAGDFISLARMILSQIDGPPPAALDVTSGGQPVNAAIIINGVESRPKPPQLDLGQREDDAD